MPAAHRDLLRDGFATLHYQRARVLVPVMLVLCAAFLLTDFLLLSTRPGPALWVYVILDGSFLLFHAAFAVYLYRHPPQLPLRMAYGYAIVPLLWAVATSTIEYQRTANFPAVMLAVLGVSALGLFSPGGLSLLLVGTLSAFVAATAFWPGGSPLGLDGAIWLLALAGLALAVSRSLHGAVVRQLISAEQLQRANAALDEARLNLIRQDKLASLGVLSAGIAHEINNPLAFVKSSLLALERNHDALSGPPAVLAENRSIFGEAKEGFRRIGEVIQALGSFSRTTPGDALPFDLNEAVKTTLTLTRGETHGRIVVETDFGEVPLIPALGSEVNQVLLNLLMNAYQAVGTLPAGDERRVKVTTRAEPDAVLVEVSNNGPSIPAAQRERIFEPFFTTKAPGAGMGLGLSLSWHIAARRHAGSLVLLDREPVTFQLRLPRVGQSATQSTK